MYYLKKDKVKIVVDIVRKLKTFPSKSGNTIDLYQDCYPFKERFKNITNRWINEPNSKFQGTIYFEELGKYFEYDFPDNQNKQPLFVLRHSSHNCLD